MCTNIDFGQDLTGRILFTKIGAVAEDLCLAPAEPGCIIPEPGWKEVTSQSAKSVPHQVPVEVAV